MQLKEYLAIFVKKIWILIATMIIVIFSTYLFCINMPDKYTGSLSLYANIVSTNNTANDYYNYDSYYSLLSSQILPDLVISWLKDPANITQIYENANQTLPDIELKKYAKLITTKKYPPSSVQITYESANKNEVEQIMQSTKTLLETKSAEIKDKKLINNMYIEVSNPIVVKDKIATSDNLLIASVIGFVLGLALIYFINYLETTKK